MMFFLSHYSYLFPISKDSVDVKWNNCVPNSIFRWRPLQKNICHLEWRQYDCKITWASLFKVRLAAPLLTSFGSLVPNSSCSLKLASQIANFMWPTWGPSGSCRSQMGPMLAPWTLLSGVLSASPVYTSLGMFTIYSLDFERLGCGFDCVNSKNNLGIDIRGIQMNINHITVLKLQLLMPSCADVLVICLLVTFLPEANFQLWLSVPYLIIRSN